jgi:hypothetical protein
VIVVFEEGCTGANGHKEKCRGGYSCGYVLSKGMMGRGTEVFLRVETGDRQANPARI